MVSVGPSDRIPGMQQEHLLASGFAMQHGGSSMDDAIADARARGGIPVYHPVTGRLMGHEFPKSVMQQDDYSRGRGGAGMRDERDFGMSMRTVPEDRFRQATFAPTMARDAPSRDFSRGGAEFNQRDRIPVRPEFDSRDSHRGGAEFDQRDRAPEPRDFDTRDSRRGGAEFDQRDRIPVRPEFDSRDSRRGGAEFDSRDSRRGGAEFDQRDRAPERREFDQRDSRRGGAEFDQRDRAPERREFDQHDSRRGGAEFEPKESGRSQPSQKYEHGGCHSGVRHSGRCQCTDCVGRR